MRPIKVKPEPGTHWRLRRPTAASRVSDDLVSTKPFEHFDDQLLRLVQFACSMFFVGVIVVVINRGGAL